MFADSDLSDVITDVLGETFAPESSDSSGDAFGDDCEASSSRYLQTVKV